MYVQAYVDQNFDTPIYDAFLPRTGPLTLPGYEKYSITFKKDTATVLEIAKDPGLGFVAFFFMVMAGGFTVSLYTTFTRCWVKISPNSENPATVNVFVSGLAEKNKVSFERDFERVAGRIRDSLASATAGRDITELAPSLEANQA
jgi:cytochrome c biogenesis protein ResB